MESRTIKDAVDLHSAPDMYDYESEYRLIKALANAPRAIKDAVDLHSEPEKINYEYFARFTKIKGFIVTNKSERLDSLSESELAKYGVIRNEKGKLRIIVNEDYLDYDFKTEFIKLKYMPEHLLNCKGLKRVKSYWLFDGKAFESKAKIEKTWMDEAQTIY